jgi:hypothetical protein
VHGQPVDDQHIEGDQQDPAQRMSLDREEGGDRRDRGDDDAERPPRARAPDDQVGGRDLQDPEDQRRPAPDLEVRVEEGGLVEVLLLEDRPRPSIPWKNPIVNSTAAKVTTPGAFGFRLDIGAPPSVPITAGRTTALRCLDR